MPNFILTGGHCDGVAEAQHGECSEQHRWADAEELAERLESSEKHHSLTLVEREYSYKGLRSWWQSIERQLNPCTPEDRRVSDCTPGVANHESSPKDGDSEPQENRYEELTGAVENEEECVQAAECEQQQHTPSGRRSMQATPEALFLAEKLQQLADTTREMAQHLLSPEARRVSTPRAEAPGLASDPDNTDLEFVRQKILLLDDVVEELSQYRLMPLALDMSERSMGEPSESECLWSESTARCNNAVVGSTNCDGKGFQQDLDVSNSGTFLAEDKQNTVPYATESLSMWSDSVHIEDEYESAAGTSIQGSENADVSGTSADDDPSLQQFAAEVTTVETISNSVQLSQREPQMGSLSSQLDTRTSDFSSQELRFSTCHGKEAPCTAQRIRPSPSKLDRLDRATTTTLRLLSYPIMRHALNAEAANATEGQKMALKRDVAPSDTEPSQKEPQTNSCSSYLDTSVSDLLAHERGFASCHGNERPCEVRDSAYQGQRSSSKPVGVDGMIALVQRLLRLQIMAHA